MNTVSITADGSNTLFNDTIGENYHSKHGAVQESLHVFINAGLQFSTQNSNVISILEVGFGTGLNFLLSLKYSIENNIQLNYTALEAFPLDLKTIETLNYNQFVSSEIYDAFLEKYNQAFFESTPVLTSCNLKINKRKLEEFSSSEKFDLMYYDAFSVRHQPELWTDAIIEKACNLIKENGTFVTYAITGNLKRAIKSCGFQIEKLPGAPGKREMLRGIKTS